MNGSERTPGGNQPKAPRGGISRQSMSLIRPITPIPLKHQ